MWEGMDQRQFPRVKCRCVVRLKQGASVPVISTVTENVGLGGVCVLMDQGLDIFLPVDLEITLSEGQPPLKVQGTVVWVVRRGEIKRGPAFDTGIEFTELSAQDRARLEAILEKVSSR